MGIGTSLGAYFDDEAQHQAGIPTVPKDGVVKPKDTGDDNVLPEANEEPRIIEAGFKDVANKLFGLNGVERYKLWPERMLEDLQNTAGDVSAGKIPMWAMTPDGEFHTSIEGIEAAHKLMPAANNLPVTVQLRGAGLKALEDYHEAPYETGAHAQFLQLLSQVRRQPSNILEGEVLPPEPRPGTPEFDQAYGYSEGNYRTLHERIHPDRMSDEDFYNWGEYQPYLTLEQNARWTRIDQAYEPRAAHEFEQDPYVYDQEDFNPLDRIPGRFKTDAIKEAQTQDKIKLIKEDLNLGYVGNAHNYVFANKDGIGTMQLTERKGGKDLWVDWIGAVTGKDTYAENAGTFGGMTMRQIISQLKDEFPKAERIGGFRVSGARSQYGASGSRDAWTRIRPAKKSSLEEAYDRAQAEKNQ